MPRKEWRRRPSPPPGVAQTLGLPLFQAHLLHNRGITSRAQLDAFLTADSSLSNDPFLLPDMGSAVSRLQRALTTSEVVAIFGDFDADGVTGTALLAQALREMGAKVISYLPDRVDEGHGLNRDAIESLRAQEASLLITVDCGSSSVEEVETARSIGMDTIVTDHHSIPPVLPNASALVNPRRSDSTYPYDGLTGAGLSFKLAEALYAAAGRPRPDHLLELAAIGTVGDVGPLTGENRYIVRAGLERLNETQYPGLRALVGQARLKFGSLDVESLSYGLIPRLNAAGRLGHASLSLRLLSTDSLEEAYPLAEELERHNLQRREHTDEGVEQARIQVHGDGDGIAPILVVEHRGWLPGVLGLIAGRLAEEYYRPAVAVSIEGPLCRASARSIPELDIVETLAASRELFHRFGGHPRAAGFTASTADLPRIKRALLDAARQKLDGAYLAPSIQIDCEISPALLDDHNLDFIRSLGPFGEGNPSPVFLTRNAHVVDARPVGQTNDHWKMRIGHSSKTWDAIAFRQGAVAVANGNRVDLVYTAGVDDWGEMPHLQLNVLEFRVRR